MWVVRVGSESNVREGRDWKDGKKSAGLMAIGVAPCEYSKWWDDSFSGGVSSSLRPMQCSVLVLRNFWCARCQRWWAGAQINYWRGKFLAR